jgi:hypothetical protein
MEEEIRKEFNRLKQELENFEQKYLFAGNYKLVAAILDKLDVNFLEITYSELNKQELPKYIAEFNEDTKTVTVRRYINDNK